MRKSAEIYMGRHKGNRVCQYCSKTFARPTTLKIHIDGFCKDKNTSIQGDEPIHLTQADFDWVKEERPFEEKSGLNDGIITAAALFGLVAGYFLFYRDGSHSAAKSGEAVGKPDNNPDKPFMDQE